MNLVFVNPPNDPQTEKSILIEPIDVLQIATLATNWGYSVRVVDMDISEKPWAKLKKEISSHEPTVLIVLIDYHIPLHTNQAIKNVHKIARVAKNNGVSWVVAGGKIATYLPQLFINKDSRIDFAVRFELEPVLQELLLRIEKLQQPKPSAFADICNIVMWEEDSLVSTPSKPSQFHVDSLPISDRSLLHLNDYIDVRTMLSSRGCPMNCNFCHVPGFWGKWRYRSADQVFQEIDILANQHSAKKILFLDDNATVNSDRMIEISEKIITSGIKVKLGCLGSISVFNEAAMQKMYQAGFRWIHFGIESGSDQLLRKINKNINKAKINRVIEKTKSIGFRIRTSWILDLPGMNQSDLTDTISYIQELQTDEIRLHYYTTRLGSTNSDQMEVNQLPSQYIHNNSPNQASLLPTQLIQKQVEQLLDRLEDYGYLVVKNAKAFSNESTLKKAKKIVLLCPMRYGLFW